MIRIKDAKFKLWEKIPGQDHWNNEQLMLKLSSMRLSKVKDSDDKKAIYSSWICYVKGDLMERFAEVEDGAMIIVTDGYVETWYSKETKKSGVSMNIYGFHVEGDSAYGDGYVEDTSDANDDLPF